MIAQRTWDLLERISETYNPGKDQTKYHKAVRVFFNHLLDHYAPFNGYKRKVKSCGAHDMSAAICDALQRGYPINKTSAWHKFTTQLRSELVDYQYERIFYEVGCDMEVGGD